MATVITGAENIRKYQQRVQLAAMKLELLGLKNSRGSVIAMVKKQYGLKGNKQSIVDQFRTLIDAQGGE